MIITAEVSELTRKIKLPTDRVLSVNGDYQVDGIAFKLPETYEGDFDFTTAAARVHWTGVDKVEHTNLITEEDGNGYPLWIMPSELTQGGHGVIEFAISFVATDETAAVTKRWISDPVSFRNRRTVNGSNEDEEAEEEAIYDRLASAIAAVRAAQAEVEDTNAVLSSLTGSAPVPVENRADMVDDGHLYLYTGDETGLVTGNLYYYVNGTLTNGGQYGSMEVDATLTQSGQAADAAVTGAEISAIKEDLSAIQTATAEDVDKALKAKTVANGKVTEWEFGATGDENAVPLPIDPESKYGTSGQVLETLGDGKTRWRDVDAVDPEVIEGAVTDWLDEHPEATTTVKDSSLTEAKFTSATWAKVKNDYVTPQMYGALADGSTDDTVAIQAAFDSGYDVYFPHGVYMTSGVTISSTIHVKFDNATLKANTTYQEYVLNVTKKVYFLGQLIIKGDSKAFCGIIFTGAGSSYIEMIDVDYCLSWGVDIVSGGHMVFDHIYTAYCGNSISATVSYVSSKVLNIDSSLTSLRKEILSADKYYSRIYVQDDTGYNDDTSEKRPGPMIYSATGYDKESGQIATASTIKSDYTSKSCYILCGGGIHVNVNINTQIDFNIIDTRLGPTGIRFDSTYGHHIQNIYSQSDRVPIMFASYNLGTIIGSITAEGSKSGYDIWSANYNYSVILAMSTGYNNNFLSSQVCTVPHKSSPLYNPTHLKTLIRRTIPFYYYMGEALILTEQSPDNIYFQNSRSGLTIALMDNFQSIKSYNPWGVKTIYFMPNTAQDSDVTFKLSNSLIDNGYTIHGGQNGVITFSRPSLWFKVEIYLSYGTKTFTLSVTPITKFEPSE